jgi:restriction system protein
LKDFLKSIWKYEIMPIPKYDNIMLPLLQLARDGKVHSSREMVERLSGVFNLSQEERDDVYGTKDVSIFYDRVHWALTYLKHARLLEGTKRGYFQITKRGLGVLKQKPENIDDSYLTRFSEFIIFLGRNRKN